MSSIKSMICLLITHVSLENTNPAVSIPNLISSVAIELNSATLLGELTIPIVIENPLQGNGMTTGTAIPNKISSFLTSSCITFSSNRSMSNG